MTLDELYALPSYRHKEKTLPLIKVLDDLYNITFFHFVRVYHENFRKISIGNSLNWSQRYWSEYASIDGVYFPEILNGFELLIYDGQKTAKNKKEREMYEERLQHYGVSDQKDYQNFYTKKFIENKLSSVYNARLTNMEATCLNWALKGKTAEETAIILNKSRRTIEGHLLSIKAKLGCHKISSALIKAEKMGFIKHGSVFTEPVA